MLQKFQNFSFPRGRLTGTGDDDGGDRLIPNILNDKLVKNVP